MGWQPTPKTRELPPWHRAGGAGRNPARAGGEEGRGGVLEHEDVVGDRFEGGGGERGSLEMASPWWRHSIGEDLPTAARYRGWGSRLRVRRASWSRVRAQGGAGRVGQRRRRAAAGRTLVVDGGTSATPRGAAAGLSDEALVDGEVSAGVQQLDGA
jgi:hypothetical protein